MRERSSKFLNGAVSASITHLYNAEGEELSDDAEDPRKPRQSENLQEYRRRLESMRSEIWEGNINFNTAALLIGAGDFNGILINTGSGEIVRISGVALPLGVVFGTFSGQINVVRTGFTNPADMINASLGIFFNISAGLSLGPVDTGSAVTGVHVSPNGIITPNFFPSQGDINVTESQIKAGFGGGLVGFQIKNITTNTIPPHPFE